MPQRGRRRLEHRAFRDRFAAELDLLRHGRTGQAHRQDRTAKPSGETGEVFEKMHFMFPFYCRGLLTVVLRRRLSEHLAAHKPPLSEIGGFPAF
ncbi:MAG: hypothetical protein Kow0013_02650 [Pararhodobacter sp.]